MACSITAWVTLEMSVNGDFLQGLTEVIEILFSFDALGSFTGKGFQFFSVHLAYLPVGLMVSRYTI
jgi:hypothetical protein